MGMDPLDKDETYELTFVLKGPVHKSKWKDFRTAIDDFLKACALIEDGINAAPKNKLQIREQRGGVRKNIP